MMGIGKIRASGLERYVSVKIGNFFSKRSNAFYILT